MCAVIGFEQDLYTLSERTAPYSLSVTTVRGFLPQDLVLGVSAIPDTACENTLIDVQHTQAENTLMCNIYIGFHWSDSYKCIEALKL